VSGAMPLLPPYTLMVWTGTTFSGKSTPLIIIDLWIIKIVAFWLMKYLMDLHISRMFAEHAFVFGRSSEVFDKIVIYCSAIYI
jgi:hypothetical protein